MRFTKVKIDNFFNLKDVNLDLTNGNTLIVGPNGSGKTNIIKCIQFLVDQILNQPRGCIREQRFLSVEPPVERRVQQHGLQWEVTVPKIWNPNEDCFIEVHAWFNKAEVELFSELRILFLMADICYVVRAVTEFLVDQALDHHIRHVKGCEGTPTKPVSERREEFITAVLQDEEGMFYGFPEATFRKIINIRNHTELLKNNSYHRDIPSDDPCRYSLATEIAKGLFPKLLKITRRAMSEQVRPMEGDPDMKMWARTQKTVVALKSSIDV